MNARPPARPPTARTAPVGQGWLRRLGTGFLVIVLCALVLQPMAHARAGGHAGHHDAVAFARMQPCDHAHPAHQGEMATSRHCDAGPSRPDMADCCQSCLIAAIAPEPPVLAPHAGGGDHLSRSWPSPLGRIPPRLLRPPV